MKWKWVIFGLVGTAAFLIGFNLLNRRDVEADVFPLERQFEIIYTAKITDIPKDAKNVRVWIPLASTRDGQKILERKIETSGSYQITRDTLFGNEILYFESNGTTPAEINFNINYTVRVSKNEFAPTNSSEEGALYLKPTRFMKVDEEVKKRLHEATKENQSLPEKARNIYDYVIQYMVYDKQTPGWGNGDTLRACLMGKGNCTDFHSLFISMAQATEIPARFKIGFTIPKEAEGVLPGYHCWAEFYEQENGWRPIDASDAWKHPERKEAYFGNFDTNKFLISVGRDVELVPPQSGDPLNIFFYPYVEVDQKTFNGVKTSFHFKNKT